MTVRKVGDILENSSSTDAPVSSLARADFYYTAEEVRRIIMTNLDSSTGVSREFFIQLSKIASKLSQKAHVERQELINEAIKRILDERRRWPRGVPILVFMKGVLNSIASEWYQMRMDIDKNDYHNLIWYESYEASGRDNIKYHELIETVRNIVSDDTIAASIFSGIVNGKSQPEIINNLEITDTMYRSKMRLIRRRLEKYRKDVL